MVDIPAQSSAAGVPEAQVLRSLSVRDLPGAVIAVDRSSRVLHWSAGAQSLYGWSAEEAVGRSVRELIGLRAELADEVKAATHAGQGWDGEFAAVTKQGRPLLVYVSNAPFCDDDGTVVGVVGVSLDITSYAATISSRAAQLEHARRDAERLADRNARLVRVSEQLANAVDAATVADVVLSQAVDALRVDAGGITVVDRDRLHVLASTGYEQPVVEHYSGLPLEARSPLTDLLRTATVLRTGSHEELLETYPTIPHSLLSESFVGIPLEVEDRVVGALALSCARPSAFSGEDVVFLATLGRQCAQALERIRLLTAERAGRERMTFLAMASERLSSSLDAHETLDAVADLAVPAAGDWCAVHLLDGAGQPQLVTVHHRDPDKQALLDEIFRRYPLDLSGAPGMGLVVRDGRTLRVREMTHDVLDAIAVDDDHLDGMVRLGIGSALGVPLSAHGRTFGMLSVASAESDAYGDAEVTFIEDLAHRISAAVDNALRYRRERQTALTLQRSLLPNVLPDLPGLTVAHRYLPGTAGAEVGGDWYDLLPLTRGRVGVVIGDVMGRGIAAAAVMGQLRAAVRTCALVEESPSAVLALVDAAMSSLGQTSLTTCLYGVLDPATRRLTVASAGHLPPLVVHRDGGGEYLELDPGPPLGVGHSSPPEVEVELPEGALLLLFTDGLVEGREQPVEEGMLALRNAVADVGPLQADGLEDLCDGLLVAMGRDGRPDDDSALLAVWTGGDQRSEDGAHLHLAGHLSEVARARRLTVEWAERTSVDVDEAALLVTEVATNALRHGGPGVDVWVRPATGSGLRVELIDGRSDALPRMRRPDADDEGGRGLLIVSALARSWGSDKLSAGKCVWFELGPS